MAYDAGMLSCVLREINEKLEGGKVDKIYQPSHDEVVLLIRSRGGDHRLFINAGSSGARMNITKSKTENPATPPMFCMMLRKHFTGARFHSCTQLGFERAARLTFDTHDDLGFSTQKHIICEIMGRFSNIIITNAEDKILGVLKSIDFTTSEKQQVLSGMIYELPPKQNKIDPTSDELDIRMFNKLASACEGTKSAEKFIISNFAGIAPVVAREIVYRSAGKTDATMDECSRQLAEKFFEYVDVLKSGKGTPYIVRNKEKVPVEYSFMELRQYGRPMEVTRCETFGQLIDDYFEERSRDERLHRKAADIFKLLSNAETRITRKMALQRDELTECGDGEKYKLWGDLSPANIYRLKKGMEQAEVEN